MILHEIWPERSLIDKEQKLVGEFFNFKYFSHGGVWHNTFFSIVELDRSMKIYFQ